jgi:hypothetical protein
LTYRLLHYASVLNPIDGSKFSVIGGLIRTANQQTDPFTLQQIAPTDKVFLSRPGWVRDRIVLEEQAPGKFPHLDVTFEDAAICCNYDLAFLL